MAAWFALCGVAQAQTMPPITATPLLPPTAQPQTAPPDQSHPSPPAPTANGPQPIPLTWVPQEVAQLQVLDKVNAQNAVLTVKVGQQTQFASLNILVQACDTHPPDQAQDSAAFLTITDSRSDTPGFRGWMLANEPSASMLQSPIYDVRVVACRS
ncbi:MAG TPA: DUF2155 domain-containing protein [Acetobacteraceae bacterium]|jgi:hypothetical protein